MVDVAVSEDEATRGYCTALIDILTYLGVIELSPSGTRVASVQAGYLVHMVSTLMKYDQSLVADWEQPGVNTTSSHPFNLGVDLLAALERRRLDIDPDAQPLRIIGAAVGFIGIRLSSDELAFLFHWDENARMWQLIGGRYEQRDGTLRATMVRELAEELECGLLIDNTHVVLTELGEPFHEERQSPTYGLLTRTTFQAFAVRFIVPLPKLHAGLRWIRESELVVGATSDGQPISSAPFWGLLNQPGLDIERLITA